MPQDTSHPEHKKVPMTKLCRIAAVVLPLMFAATCASAEELIGTWLTQQGDARIRIAKCGNALCGTVTWLRDAVVAGTGQPPMDIKNPNPSLRTRKVLGIRIFEMTLDATSSWTGGIYNADDGQTYKGRLAPRGEDELEVQGCSGNLCGSEVWTRAN
jgi:uncharacterized protein (DUF2147 family)